MVLTTKALALALLLMVCERWTLSSQAFARCMRTSVLGINVQTLEMSSLRVCCLNLVLVCVSADCRQKFSPIEGKNQPWYGKSSWGHPDFDRKSVGIPQC